MSVSSLGRRMHGPSHRAGCDAEGLATSGFICSRARVGFRVGVFAVTSGSIRSRARVGFRLGFVTLSRDFRCYLRIELLADARRAAHVHAAQQIRGHLRVRFDANQMRGEGIYLQDGPIR
eukprot:7671798-Pyramimonas_sp.AAC.2